MVRTATPTLGDQRWGPGAADRFDLYKNPIRLAGGNPVMFMRHGGGGVLGSHQDMRDDTFGEMFFLRAWLRGAWNATFNQNPSVPWDLVAFSSGQRSHIKFGGGTAQSYTPVPGSSRSFYFTDAIRDCQRAIATIKRMAGLTINGVALDFDPNRIVGNGDSYGATIMALSQLAPPLKSSGASKVWYDGIYAPGSHGSRVRGCFISQPQVKCDVAYMWAAPNYPGWVGGRGDTSSAQDASVIGQQLRWTEATRLLDVSGAWTRNSFSGLVAGDRVNLRGVNCTAGAYTVEQLNSAVQVKLTTSPGASAFFIGNCNWGNSTKLISTATSGAFSSIEPGDKIWLTAGTGCIVGEYTVASVLSGTSLTLTADINGAGGNIGDNSIQFYSGYYGGAQLTEHAGSQIRDMASIIRYFEQGDLGFYPGFNVHYATQGTHVKPYFNPHDSAQLAELATAATNAGVPLVSTALGANELDCSAQWTDGTSSPSAAVPAAVLSRYQAIESWMAAQVS